MAFAAYAGSHQTTIQSSATGSAPSSAIAFAAPAANNTFTFKRSFVLGGNVAGGVNAESVGIDTIAPSGSLTINLQSLTDTLGATGVVLVRVKRWFFVLLDATQDATNGTAAASIAIGNAASNANLLNMGGTTPTQTVGSGDQWGYATAGAAGIAVDASHLNVKVVNNDAGLSAAVFRALAGATT